MSMGEGARYRQAAGSQPTDSWSWRIEADSTLKEIMFHYFLGMDITSTNLRFL